jgi:hypothetical protein
MSATDLKSIMHRRIDQLTDEETLEDLFQTMNSFLEGRTPWPDSDSSEQVERLTKSLTKIETNPQGITTDELEQKMKQWLTR